MREFKGFREFEEEDWYGYAGAERFSDSQPLIASIELDDACVDVIISGGKEPTLEVYLIKEIKKENLYDTICWMLPQYNYGKEELLKLGEEICNKIVSEGKVELYDYGMEECPV